ncbi:hypothetical protein NLI96_g13303 [Meripilus lineatus]|uniref:Uncharacterized protein n=1 Tax=Meripilus lineatus TaxID=2056292 RepID=A0AAD5Y7F6_9APHY|nr:hypothetical protein NLI96_g13303 [Physisporinus lineatus]
MATRTTMPTRSQKNAPKFDPEEPRTLNRYFQDLEELFTNCGITGEAEKKKYATTYLPVSEEDSWTLLEEYKEATKTFEDFKKKVIDLYPSCSADRKFTNDDLDRLIGQAIRNPIKDLDGLSTFYREYLKITTFMRDKNRLGEAEQSRTFKRGLPEALWNRIDARLQIKYPDHNRENHYPLDDIYNAANRKSCR